METKVITLRENDSLVKLSINRGKTIDEIRDLVIKHLIKYELIEDYDEDCGFTVQERLQDAGYSLETFAVSCFKVSFPTLLEMLKGLQLWGTANDCHECGCEVDDVGCTNSICGCMILPFEPDYDSMFGGIDYDLNNRTN